MPRICDISTGLNFALFFLMGCKACGNSLEIIESPLDHKKSAMIDFSLTSFALVFDCLENGKWKRSALRRAASAPLARLSKLRFTNPLPKMQKNYPRQDIKIGKSPRSEKARKGQKSGCFPTSERENGQKPNCTKLTKIDVECIHLLAQK